MLWFSENCAQIKIFNACLFKGSQEQSFFPSDTLIYGISRDGSKNFNIRTCEHMIFGQLTMGARQTNNAPLRLWLRPPSWWNRTFKITNIYFQFLAQVSWIKYLPSSTRPFLSARSSLSVIFEYCNKWEERKWKEDPLFCHRQIYLEYLDADKMRRSVEKHTWNIWR